MGCAYSGDLEIYGPPRTFCQAQLVQSRLAPAWAGKTVGGGRRRRSVEWRGWRRKGTSFLSQAWAVGSRALGLTALGQALGVLYGVANSFFGMWDRRNFAPSLVYLPPAACPHSPTPALIHVLLSRVLSCGKKIIYQSVLRYLYYAYRTTRWTQGKYSCTGYQNNFVPLIFCKSKRRYGSSQVSSSSQNNSSDNNKILERQGNFDSAVYLNLSFKFSKAYRVIGSFDWSKAYPSGFLQNWECFQGKNFDASLPAPKLWGRSSFRCRS